MLLSPRSSYIILGTVLLLSLLPSSSFAQTTSTDDGSWFDPGNWSAGVPDNTDEVTIASGFTIDIDGAGAASDGILVDANGTLNITGAGTWDNNGDDFYLGSNIQIGDAVFNIATGGSASNTNVFFVAIGNNVTAQSTIEGYLSTSNMFVGRDGGNGSLLVQNGGIVDNGFSVAGYGAGGQGGIFVDGATSRFDNVNDLYIGILDGIGEMEITGGAKVTSATGSVGDLGGQGSVLIDGAGSSWTNSADMYVGTAGSGILNISDGGALNNVDGYLGHLASGVGQATVTGAGSTWTNTGILHVGWDQGDGTLNITDGGAVASAGAYLGYGADSSGYALVDGAGSVWTVTGALLTIGASNGAGELVIDNGGTVISNSGTIIGSDNDSGSADVLIDNGSTLTVTNFLAVGVNDADPGMGTGSLTLLNGSSVTADNVAVGVSTTGAVDYPNQPGGTGTVLIDDSSMSVASEFIVGGNGWGIVTVQNGGTLNTDTSYIGRKIDPAYYDFNRSQVTVTGAGSVWNSTGTLYMGYVDDITGCFFNNSNCLRQTNLVSITEGGELDAADIVIGYNTSGESGSTLALSELLLSEGGILNADTITLGSGQAQDQGVYRLLLGGTATGPAGAIGQLNITSGVIRTEPTMGSDGKEVIFNHTDNDYQFDIGFEGSIIVRHRAGTTTMTRDSNFLVSSSIFVSGSSDLTINDAIFTGLSNLQVSDNAHFLATGSNGLMDITSFYVMSSGNAHAVFEDGVSLVGSDLYISGQGGYTTFREEGTSAQLGNYALVSDGGYLSLEDGADMILAGDTMVFASGGLDSYILLDGAGTTWNQTGTFYLGLATAYDGTDKGHLYVQNGADLSVTDLYVGLDGTGTEAVIDGAGSTLAADNLYIAAAPIAYYGGGGMNTLASMTISRGASVTAGTLTFGDGDPSLLWDPTATYHGILNIGAAAADAAVAPGALNVAVIGTGDVGGGEINFKHTSGGYDFDAAVTGDIDVFQRAGTTILNAASTYTGATSVLGGRLIVDGSITSDTTVSSGAALGGTGSVGNVVSSGIIAPGAVTTPGALTITGDYLGQAGSELRLNTELGLDASPTDLLVFDGGAATGATSVFIANAGGAGGYSTTDGIRVIQSVNGATTQAGMFTLGAPAQVGIYNYDLVQGGDDPSEDNDWFLRAANLAANVPVYAATPELVMGYVRETLGTVHDRMDLAEEVRAQHRAGFTGGNAGLADIAAMEGAWVRAFGGQRKFESGDAVNSGYEADFGGIQAGKDIYRAEHNNGSADHVGLYLAQGKVKADMTSVNGKAGKASFDATTGGAYWTHFTAKNAYASVSAQYSRIHKFEVTPAGGGGIDPGGDSLAASVEVGRKIKSAQGIMIEPQAQAIYQYLKLADDNDGINNISFDAQNSLTARLGVRLSRALETDKGLAIQPWGRVNLLHTVEQESRITMGADTFDTPFGGTQGEVQLGISVGRPFRSGAAGWSLYMNAGYLAALSQSPSTDGWTLSSGVKWMW